MSDLYFAQFADLHVGMRGRCAEFDFAERHLTHALAEVEELSDVVQFILMTGDQVTGGTGTEWEVYQELTQDCTLPRYHVAANHDLGGQTRAQFEERIGPTRHCFDAGGIRFFVLDEYEKGESPWGFGWRARLRPDTQQMIEDGLREWGPQPVIVACHAPLLKLSDEGFVEMWQGSNAQTLVDLLKPSNFLAFITGHWHRNCEWDVDGLRLINTGSLLGQQYIATDPYWFTGVRAGYRLFCWDGAELRTCWRDVDATCQSKLVWLGDHHTGGPRPQVKPTTIHQPAVLTAQALMWQGEVEAVEVGVGKHFWFRGHRDMIQVHKWMPMERAWQGLWSDWQLTLDPADYPEGDYVLVTRAKAKGHDAFKGEDAVPVTLAREPREQPLDQREVLFTLWGMPVVNVQEAR